MKPRQLFIAGVLLCATFVKAAPIRDNGIDPEHLGKGDWISYFSCATNNFCDPNSPPDIVPIKSVTDIPSVLAFEKKLGMDYVIVKAGTGSTNFMLGNERQFTTNLVRQAHAVGLKIFGYTRSDGADVPGEIEIAKYVHDCGADGFVIDAEAEWESNRPWIGKNGAALAIKLCEGIRALYPNWFLGHSPMPIISLHQSFPMKEFGLYCDAVMPQLYWRSFKKTPIETIDWMDQEWKRWQSSLAGNYRNAIKPIVPVAPGGSGMPPHEVVEFLNYLKSDPNCVSASGYRGVNFFRAGRYTPEVLGLLRELNFSAPTSLRSFLNVRTKDLTETNATITWSTRSIARCTFEVGTSTNYGTQIPDPDSSFGHSVTVTNLVANTIYHFRMRAEMNGHTEVSDDFLLITHAHKAAADVVIDNSDAVKVGEWNVASGSSDKFGKDYFHKGPGDGKAYVEFATNITTSGLYQIFEMHSDGNNRSARVPHVISFGVHVQTNHVNQKRFGGRWNLVAVVKVSAGERLSVKITDKFEEDKTVVVADAIKITGYTPSTREITELDRP